MGSISKFRSRRSAFSDDLDYAAMIDPGIILNKNGSLMAAWRVRGPDLSSSSAGQRNAVAARMNQLLLSLDGSYMVHMDAVRESSRRYPKRRKSHFPDRVTEAIDEERRQSFEDHNTHFETDLILTLTYSPPDLAQSKLSQAIYTDDGREKLSPALHALETFKEFLHEFTGSLNNLFATERLMASYVEGEHGEDLLPDSFLSHLRRCITGINAPLNLPASACYLDALLGADYEHGVLPRVNDKYMGVVSIEGFPHQSYQGILKALDSLPINYRWSSRFIFMDNVKAMSKIEGYRRKWAGKAKPLLDQLLKTDSSSLDQDALEMATDADQAKAEASSGLVRYGYYSSCIVIHHEDAGILEEQLDNVKAMIDDLGFPSRKETINTTDAFMASLPGNGYANIRKPMIHTLNLAHFLPLNSVWSGREHNPCPFYPPESPPLMQVASSGSTPFRLNLHVGDLGHTLIFGPTGSGKSTLLGLIAAQFRRYKQAQIFCFDKGASMLPLTAASGGEFYDVAGNDSHLQFCPLSRVDSDAEQAWAEEWICTLLELQGIGVDAKVRNTIHTAMSLHRASDADKTLSNFVYTIQDSDLREALNYYTVSGAMGNLLDAEIDTLEEGNFNTFEMEELMEKGDQAILPVLLYLFHRIEQRLTGAPSLIILDEAWIMLGHPVFRERIAQWLRVLRKKNCCVIMATQSLADAVRSGITDVLASSCPTKIFLPNDEADQEGPTALYQAMGLNEVQIGIISRSTPCRDYYVVSAEGKRLFDMELGPFTLAFVGSSGLEDLTLCRRLISEHGASWLDHWIKERGVTWPTKSQDERSLSPALACL